MKKKKGELPSGRVRYCAYIGRTEDGKQIRKSFTADTMKEAKQKAAQAMKDAEEIKTDADSEASAE